MRYEWVQQPISQFASARYTFIQFISDLNLSLQLQEEISRAWAPDVHYGQYVTDSREVRHHNSRIGTDTETKIRLGEITQGTDNRDILEPRGDMGTAIVPLALWQRTKGNKFYHERTQNPRLTNKRFCLGWGSLDHVLIDRKCTAKLHAIRTHVVEHIGCEHQDASTLFEQFLPIQLMSVASNDSVTPDSPRREPSNSYKVSFQESLYFVGEEDTFQSHIPAGFKEETIYTWEFKENNLYDCSHIDFSDSETLLTCLVSASISAHHHQ